MGYNNLAACVTDLEKHGHLVRIREEVDPHLEMASLHLRVYEKQGPALLFENIKGCRFPAVSNLFGTIERSEFIFRDSLRHVKQLVEMKSDPMKVLKKPLAYVNSGLTAFSALPMKLSPRTINNFIRIRISDLPQILNWPMDGGPFITMPQVYTEDADRPGVMNANLGMYRIQLGGNEYIQDQEIGLHYQLHRGIGIHQSKATAKGLPLKVSIFVGGPPSHPLSAVMPLPEGLSEMTFAGALGNRRFRYFYDPEGFCVSADADFVITGTISPFETKPEGPFGDHLGYYSLAHPFPLMKVHNVYQRRDNPIWSFTVVGRPPQEDTSFGALIHEIAGSALPKEIPGLHEVNAVDEAGVHPLLFAIGSERYTPYLKERKPSELLTIANHVLGSNQLSLAKYLFIAAKEDNPELHTHDIAAFLTHVLERFDPARDLHFQTNTTIDTLDYTGGKLNEGSKVVFAAAGARKRELQGMLPQTWSGNEHFPEAEMAMPGVMVIQGPVFEQDSTGRHLNMLEERLGACDLSGVALVVLVDDASFTAASVSNLVWITFTRSNPASDVHGVNSFIHDKHWGCRGPVIIDARVKPHHAPGLKTVPEVEQKVDRFALKGSPLYGIL